MKVTSDPAAFLLAQLDQAAACSLELVGETDRVRSGRHLRSEIGDQTAVSITQLFARPRREAELADGLALMRERNLEQIAAGAAVHGASCSSPPTRASATY